MKTYKFVLFVYFMALSDAFTLTLWQQKTAHGQYWLGRLIRESYDRFHRDKLRANLPVWQALASHVGPLIRAHSRGLCKMPRKVSEHG